MHHKYCFLIEELYGDFEDLETGKVHKGTTEEQDGAEVRDSEYSVVSMWWMKNNQQQLLNLDKHCDSFQSRDSAAQTARLAHRG